VARRDGGKFLCSRTALLVAEHQVKGDAVVSPTPRSGSRTRLATCGDLFRIKVTSECIMKLHSGGTPTR
jgi:hypothetical protein